MKPTSTGQKTLTTATPAGVASLEDYQNFHGMLCRPSTAQRCIDSFVANPRSKILFLPYDYHANNHTLSIHDYRPTSISDSSSRGGVLSVLPESMQHLSLLTYYLLVLFSLTGLSSLLGRTKFLEGRCYDDEDDDDESNIVLGKPIKSRHFHDLLQVQPHVLEYLVEGEKYVSNLKLKRRFEYDFGGLVPVQVIMLHFEEVDETTQKRILHLVEVYHCKHPFLSKLLTSIRQRTLQKAVSKED